MSIYEALTRPVVFLQVTGRSSILSAALIIPFLLVAALSSITSSHIATRFGYVRPPFLVGQIILPIGMVSDPPPVFLVAHNMTVSITGPSLYARRRNSIGQVVGYTLICGAGFGAVRHDATRLASPLMASPLMYSYRVRFCRWSYLKQVCLQSFCPQ